jgi:SAM-dependent methyltransferase
MTFDRLLMKGGGVRAAIAHDLKWFSDRVDSFVYSPCPACNTKSYSSIFEKAGFFYARCTKCKTLYAILRPTVELLAEFYVHSETLNFFSKYIFPASQDARIEHIYKPRLARILAICQRYNNIGGSLVEIGAGSGQFLNLVQQAKKFSRCLAIEPSAGLAQDCRNLGLETLEMPVERYRGESVDVVCSFEVIEHLFSPVDFIDNAYRVLSDHGLCILTTPNGLGFDVLELGKDSTTVGITHLTLFNPESISILMEKCGFRVLEISTPGKLDVSLLREAWRNVICTPSNFLRYMLMETTEHVAEEFQKFLQDNLLSSHMWVVAEKK